jgi:hypothetical protein
VPSSSVERVDNVASTAAAKMVIKMTLSLDCIAAAATAGPRVDGISIQYHLFRISISNGCYMKRLDEGIKVKCPPWLDLKKLRFSLLFLAASFG